MGCTWTWRRSSSRCRFVKFGVNRDPYVPRESKNDKKKSERETGLFPLIKIWRKSELRVMVDCCLLVLVCEAVEDFIMFWLLIEIGYCNWHGWLRFKVAKSNFKSQPLNIKK